MEGLFSLRKWPRRVVGLSDSGIRMAAIGICYSGFEPKLNDQQIPFAG